MNKSKIIKEYNKKDQERNSQYVLIDIIEGGGNPQIEIGPKFQNSQTRSSLTVFTNTQLSSPGQNCNYC